MIESIISKYFIDAILLVTCGSFFFSKFMIDKVGEDRAGKIKEAILIAMLWAEQELGIGSGPEKWKIAWIKLIEILKKQKVKIKEGKISYVKNLMKAKVPEVNEIIYKTMPDSIRNARQPLKK